MKTQLTTDQVRKFHDYVGSRRIYEIGDPDCKANLREVADAFEANEGTYPGSERPVAGRLTAWLPPSTIRRISRFFKPANRPAIEL